MHRHQTHLQSVTPSSTVHLFLVSLLLHWATTHSKYIQVHSHHHLVTLELSSFKSLRATLLVGNQCLRGGSHPLVPTQPLGRKFMSLGEGPSSHSGHCPEKEGILGIQLFWDSSLLRSALWGQGKRDWEDGKWHQEAESVGIFWVLSF